MNTEKKVIVSDIKGDQLVENFYRMLEDIHRALFTINKQNKETSHEQGVADKKAKLMIKAIKRT